MSDKKRVKPLPNKWESDYERDVLFILLKAGEIRAYHYEGLKLRLANNTTYTPDWFVVYPGHFELHEVKGGFWRDDARVKIKVAAEMFPYFKFVAVTKIGKTGRWSSEDF